MRNNYVNVGSYLKVNLKQTLHLSTVQVVMLVYY